MFVLKDDVCAHDKQTHEWLSIHCGCDGLFRIFLMRLVYNDDLKKIWGHTWEICTDNTFKNFSDAEKFLKNYVNNLNTGNKFNNV